MAKKIQETARGKKTKLTNPVVIIVCEGKETEPSYFENFKKRDKPLKIEIVKNAAGKSYPALIKKAVESKRKYVDGTESKWDVWCVSDVDVDYKTPDSQSARNKQLKEYAKNATDNNFKIALSNPCFEVWFLLHFTPNIGYMQDCNTVEKVLSKHLHNYQKNRDVFGLLADKLESAVSNGKKLKQYHEEKGKKDFIDVAVNPYTNVWELVESLCN